MKIKILDKILIFIRKLINSILKSNNLINSNEILKITWGPLFFGLIVILFFFGIGGIWSFVAPIDGAVHGIGEVVVSSNKKVVQHLGDGIINKILVKEGQIVKKGQPLILLNNVNEKANLNIIKEKLLLLLITEARLITIISDLDRIEFPKEIKKLSDEYFVNKEIKNQIKLFNFQRKNMLGKIYILDQRIKQLYDEILGLNSQLDSFLKQYNLIYDELEAKTQLFKGGYIGKLNILALKKQFAEVEGKVGYYLASISQAQKKIIENKLKIVNIKNDFQEKAGIELKEISILITDLRKKLIVAENALSRTIIISPQNGVINDIRYHTNGGVIQSGVPIMSIVPSNDDLIINAKIKTKNIEEIISAQKKNNLISINGFDTSLKVKVRLSSYSVRRLGLINGIVSHISPDALDDPKFGRYYSIRVSIPKLELDQFKNVYLYPGMPVEIYIVTQSRTFLSFLFSPIISILDRSFRER